MEEALQQTLDLILQQLKIQNEILTRININMKQMIESVSNMGERLQ